MGSCVFPNPPVHIVQSQNVIIGEGASSHGTTNSNRNNDQPKFIIKKHSPHIENANSQQTDSSAPPPLIRRVNQQKEPTIPKIAEPINYGSHNISKFKAVCSKCMESHLDRFLDNCYEKELCKCNGYGVVEYDVGVKRKCQKCLSETTISLENCKRCLGKGYIPN